MQRRLLSLLLTLVVPVAAWSQTFPSQPIQIVVPYPAGGTTDAMARAIQEPLSKALGQPVIVENKSGASGVLAAREVARGKPDGHVLLFINSGIVAVTPHVQKDAGFDGVKDFTPVAMVTASPLVLVVPGSLPVSDLRGFIAWAKQQPKPVTFASAGVGSFGHLSSELFGKAAGLKLTHIPYRGQAPTTNAALTGEVNMLITSLSGTMRQHVEAGKLKLLGVGSAQPHANYAGWPTIASVLPGYAAETWFGFITTAGTPPEIVAKLHQAVNGALAQKDVVDKMLAQGQPVVTMSPEQMSKLIAEDSARWGQVVRENNITNQ